VIVHRPWTRVRDQHGIDEVSKKDVLAILYSLKNDIIRV
jgi:hypothetical protein